MNVSRRSKKIFPERGTWDQTGLVAISGKIDFETLLTAYIEGIFPWPSDEVPVIPWFSPDPRGVLEFSNLHLSHSFEKFLKKQNYVVTVNQAFTEVMRECALAQRPGQDGTWIKPQMIQVYSDLFKAGFGLSIEAWEIIAGDDASTNSETTKRVLVGGIYGVLTQRYFSAESMFYKKSNASKLCFYHLVNHLQKQGMKWMDVQMVTDVSGAFGATYIPRKEFLTRIT